MDDRDGAKPRSRGGLVVGAWGRVRCRNREDERECNAGGDRLRPMEGVQTPLGGENGRRLMVGRSEGSEVGEAPAHLCPFTCVYLLTTEDFFPNVLLFFRKSFPDS